VSHKALTADFKAVSLKKTKGNTDLTYVTALYVTIAGRSPTSVGMAYWQGLLVLGENRMDVGLMFSASDGLLPPPEVTWATPANVTAGTQLGPIQLNAAASVPGVFMYSSAPGTVLGTGNGEKLTVVFNTNRHGRLPHRYRRRFH
jgi:hypothetical protein